MTRQTIRPILLPLTALVSPPTSPPLLNNPKLPLSFPFVLGPLGTLLRTYPRTLLSANRILQTESRTFPVIRYLAQLTSVINELSRTSLPLSYAARRRTILKIVFKILVTIAVPPIPLNDKSFAITRTVEHPTNPRIYPPITLGKTFATRTAKGIL